MSDTSILVHLRKVDGRVKQQREEAFAKVVEYIGSIDKYLISPEIRKMRGILNYSDGPNARKIKELLRENIDPDLEALVDGLRIEEKELFEASCFYEQVTKILNKQGVNYEHVIDFCSGNCLNGALWLLHGAKQVYFCDIHESKASMAVRQRLELAGYNQRFRLDNVNIIYQEKMESYINDVCNKENLLVTAIHACLGLTDRIIFSAIKHRLPFAVVPCCYSRDLKQHFGAFIEYPTQFYELEPYFDDFETFVDMIRINYATQQGYKVIMRALPKRVTEKNRILIGIPSL